MKDKELNELVAKVLSEVSTGMTKAAGSHNAQMLHGQGGLLSGQGIERDVLTAMVRPQGIAQMLPLIPSVFENPAFATILGIEENSNDRPTEACGDAPTGYMTGAELTAAFGLIRKDTSTIDIMKTMVKKNRGDMSDLVLRGRVLGENYAGPSGMNDSDILNVMTKSEMINAGVRADRTLAKDLWRGTGAAPTFRGLDTLIATGLVDFRTGTAVPALDSYIEDFSGAILGGGVKDIVEYLSAMEFYLRSNADNMGLSPVSWVVAMRPELWFELTSVYPCSYLTNRCNVGDTNAVVINDNVNVQMRDDMRNGMYIDINGNRYPVVLDTAIVETEVKNASQAVTGYKSSVYFVPLTINGGFPVAYREYLDYRQAGPDIALLHSAQNFWSDDGIYSWAMTEEKWCYQLHLRTEQRLILRTPQLAGKIQNIGYQPLKHIRSPYPEDPNYVAGGVSTRAADSINWG